jgi:hypothetical protein
MIRRLRWNHLWPDGFIELLIHYGTRYHLENHENPLPHGFFIGPLTRYTRLYTLGRLRLFGIRFYPWGFSFQHSDDGFTK